MAGVTAKAHKPEAAQGASGAAGEVASATCATAIAETGASPHHAAHTVANAETGNRSAISPAAIQRRAGGMA